MNNVIAIYPGAQRRIIEASAGASVFDEQSLDHLAQFGLDGFLTDPSTATQLPDLFTPDNALKGMDHFGDPRVYLLEGADGQSCIVDKVPRHLGWELGLKSLGAQELLHDAFESTPHYNAARAFGYVSLRADGGDTGYFFPIT